MLIKENTQNTSSLISDSSNLRGSGINATSTNFNYNNTLGGSNPYWYTTSTTPVTSTKDKIETLNRLLSTLTSENMTAFGGKSLVKQLKSKLQTLIEEL